MGIIRKLISGSLAVGTGGVSLGFVQFRSDTERGTRQTKKLRQELGKLNQAGGVPTSAGTTSTNDSVITPQPEVGDSALRLSQSYSPVELPVDTSAGWKQHPEDSSLERFWNGSTWTSMTRPRSAP